METSAFELQCFESTLRTLRLQPTEILSSERRLPDNQNDPLLRVARPTWIGKGYRVGGVLLLGKNPAGGSVSRRDVSHPSDHDFASALERLADTRDIKSYRAWRDVAQPRAMSTWRIWNISALAIIHALRPLVCDPYSVAFGNLVPFRTSGNKVMADEFRRGWERDVGLVVRLLKPRLIVKMTAEFADLSRYTDIEILSFRRSNGDNFITPAGTADLEAIHNWAEHHRAA